MSVAYLSSNVINILFTHSKTLPFEIELKIEKSDPVMLLSQYVEEMDLTDLYSTYERIRENQATPRQLLKILLYGYMNREYSSRAIETRCKRDINFMYLLEDNPAPDHSTIARFRSLHFSLCAEKIISTDERVPV